MGPAWRGKGREVVELGVFRAWRTWIIELEVESPGAALRCDMKDGRLKRLRVVIGAAPV